MPTWIFAECKHIINIFMFGFVEVVLIRSSHDIYNKEIFKYIRDFMRSVNTVFVLLLNLQTQV